MSLILHRQLLYVGLLKKKLFVLLNSFYDHLISLNDRLTSTTMYKTFLKIIA